MLCFSTISCSRLFIALNSPEIKSSLEIKPILVIRVHNNSEIFADHCWGDVNYFLLINRVIVFLTSRVPLSTVVGCPDSSILGGLVRNSIDLSLPSFFCVLIHTAAITSSLQRHRGDLEVLISWHDQLKPIVYCAGF